MARPVGSGFKPTDEERHLVRHMSAAGVPHERICSAVRDGIDAKTMRKHFRAELDIGKDLVTAAAMGQLVRAISRGELGAVCFWLKCKAGWHEKAVQEVTGAEGTPLFPTKIEVVLVPAATLRE